MVEKKRKQVRGGVWTSFSHGNEGYDKDFCYSAEQTPSLPILKLSSLFKIMTLNTHFPSSYHRKENKIEFDLDDFEYEEDAIAYIASFEEEKINTNDPPEVILWNEYLAVRVCAEGKSDFVVANRMLTSES